MLASLVLGEADPELAERVAGSGSGSVTLSGRTALYLMRRRPGPSPTRPRRVPLVGGPADGRHLAGKSGQV